MSSHHEKSLNHAKAGDWEQAHEAVRSHSDKLSCLIHGYLHRVEGDLDNARYWYGQGREKLPGNTLDEEWSRLYQLAKGQ